MKSSQDHASIARGALRPLAVALLAAALCGTSRGQCVETVTLRSGNGAIGATDPQLHLLGSFAFTAQFTPADFQAARNGPPASVVQPFNQWSQQALPGHPAAKWVAIQPDLFGGSALFAQDFQVTATPMSGAVLALTFEVDNLLGNAANPGLFLNGIAVPGFPSGGTGSFTIPYLLGPYDVTDLLVSGTNTLYVHMHNTGFLSGLIYGCTITVTTGAPAALVSFGESCPPNGSQPGPILSGSLPVLGQSAVLSVTQAPIASAGILVSDSPQPSYPILYVPGGQGQCPVYVTPQGLSVVSEISAPFGYWSGSVPIPALPQLAGASAVLQAGLVWPGGLVTTNALSIVIGC
jgi:hypothetical protein